MERSAATSRICRGAAAFAISMSVIMGKTSFYCFPFLSAVCGGLPPYHTTFLPGWEAENQKKRVRGGSLARIFIAIIRIGGIQLGKELFQLPSRWVSTILIVAIGSVPRQGEKRGLLGAPPVGSLAKGIEMCYDDSRPKAGRAAPASAAPAGEAPTGCPAPLPGGPCFVPGQAARRPKRRQNHEPY